MTYDGDIEIEAKPYETKVEFISQLVCMFSLHILLAFSDLLFNIIFKSGQITLLRIDIVEL